MKRSRPSLTRHIRVLFAFLLLVVMLIGSAGRICAAVPYSSFTYNYWGQKVPSPQAYVPTAVIDGAALGVGDLRSPLDVFVDSDDGVYLLDTGNSRILCMDPDLKVIRVISQFENDGQIDRFRNPSGLFVADDKRIYVADTGNGRIVELDRTGALIRTIGRPASEAEGVIPEGFIYQPTKVGVDPAGRIYVISSGNFEGLISLDAGGRFQGFIGAPKVAPTAADLFWSRIATREQRERRALFLPISYSSLDIDHMGFIYATVNTAKSSGRTVKTTEEIIKRLSPSGVDVLRRDGFTAPKGSLGEASIFRDIASRSFGGYSALDENNRIVFTYDDNGNLLYVFGGKGTQIGSLLEPVAIDVLTDQRILVLDKGRNAVTVYGPTEYAKTIHLAIQYYDLGQYDKSTDMWKRTLALNLNYDLAYRGIARAMLLAHRYEEAMSFAALGYDRMVYSKAFQDYRDIIIEQNFGKAFLVFVLLIFGIWVWRRRLGVTAGHPEATLKSDTRLRRLYGSLRYSLYVILHPFDGFWGLKHDKKGDALAATIILILVSISYVFLRQYTGFLFNHRDLTELNIYREMASIIVPFGLWCTVSWAMTTLMDGKGTLKDIYIASAYALTPIVLIMIPATMLSRCLVLEEAALFSSLVAFSVIWSLMLVFLGSMIIHDYNLTKNAITGVCTLAGVGFAIFLTLLFSSILAQSMAFVTDVYYEIVFRL